MGYTQSLLEFFLSIQIYGALKSICLIMEIGVMHTLKIPGKVLVLHAYTIRGS